MQTQGGLTFSGGFTVIPLAQAIAAATDDYFKYVSMLLKADGTNTSQNNTFLDSSANNITITRNGNTTQGTFTPYGDNWSNYFDGTGDYLSVANNTAFNFGNGDFTIECWVNMPNQTFGNKGLITYVNSANGVGPWGLIISQYSTVPYFYYNYTGSFENRTITGTAFAVNTWNHLAVVRNGTTIKLYQNGQETASANVGTNSLWTGYTGTFTIAGDSGVSTDRHYAGYISNLRILKGTALYTAAFTPPTTPLTNITNTSILTCQSNRFIDKSSNAFAITRAGDVSVQRFSPFAPSSAYDASTQGGSMYFDGTGDYLTIPNATELQLGGGNFTIECWVKGTSQINKIIFAKLNNSSSHEWLLYTNASGFITFAWNLGTAWVISSTPLNDSWQHIALSNVGSTITMYINGVSAGSQTAALTNSTNTLAVAAGADGASTFTGYISDVRIVKGTAVYTGAFTPPTAPLTAISGTNLLLKGTNSGVLDSAMMNNIETLGNTQISTTQKKFGTASMYFDGNGDWAFSPDKPSLQFGTGDFTVEFWVYFGSTTGFVPIMANGLGVAGGATTYDSNWCLFINAGNLQMTKYVGGVQTDYTFAWTPSTGQWYHVAVARSGTSLRAFINGTQIGTTQTSSLNFSGATNNPGFSIGRLLTGISGGTPQWLNGYIDDLRITKGHARYTANFTAPTETLPGA